MFKIIGFLIIAVLILYLGFREMKPETELSTGKAVAESISPKIEESKETATVQKDKVAISGQEAVETAEPVAGEILVDEVADDETADNETVDNETVDDKSDKESVADNEKADEEPQEEKKKLVGGAEVEWIENPNPIPSDSKFGTPPIY